MQYNSWFYLFVFLLGTVFLYYVMPLKARWGVLLVASIVFYALSSRYLIFYVVASAFCIYFAGLWIEHCNIRLKEKRKELSKEEKKAAKQKNKKKTRRILILAILVNFGILFVTKYFNFFGENMNLLFGGTDKNGIIPHLDILMPLGISFYTLSAVSYVTDIYWGKCSAQKNPLKLLLFLCFFPAITEGPISRYPQLGPQLYEGHRFDYDRFCFGAQLIIWGLVKKVVMADPLNNVVKHVFAEPGNYHSGTVIVTILLYTFQIYMDFSGCIDITRGSAQLFGVELEENFKQPFFATSVNDFWRRWHMTLGGWLRDYVFYPLSMSKLCQTISKKCRKVMSGYYAATIPGIFALLGVWIGNGVWHGAEWKYIVYGMYYYVIMVIGMLLEPLFLKAIDKMGVKREKGGYHLWQIFRTFVLINIGMTIFRAKDLKAAGDMLVSCFTQWESGIGLMNLLRDCKYNLGRVIILFFFVAALVVIGIWKEKGIRIRQSIAEKPIILRWAIYAGAILFVISFGAYGPGYGAVDFMYAQF